MRLHCSSDAKSGVGGVVPYALRREYRLSLVRTVYLAPERSVLVNVPQST
jgi:hypothetical protein